MCKTYSMVCLVVYIFKGLCDVKCNLRKMEKNEYKLAQNNKPFQPSVRKLSLELQKNEYNLNK